MKQPRIQVLLDNIELTSDIAVTLRHLGAEIELSRFGAGGRRQGGTPVDARLIVSADARELIRNHRPALWDSYDSEPCATLVLSETLLDGLTLTEELLGGRTIEFASRLSRDELSGRLYVMCGLGRSLDTMRRELESLKRRDLAHQESFRRMDEERRLAALVQRDLLPTALPRIEGAEVHTIYHPADMVSGDLYEVIRLDEDHVGFALIDATGHGVAAALISAFVRRSLKSTKIVDGVSTLLAPDEVLTRLNAELLQTPMQECQFITAIYAVYDERTQVIRWARGGASYPILARAGETPRRITSDGPIVGVNPSARFEVVEMQLLPGDRLILHTDGLESMLQRDDPHGVTDLERTAWFHSLDRLPCARMIEALRRQTVDRPADDLHADDVTVIALHLLGPDLPRKTVEWAPEEALSAVYL